MKAAVWYAAKDIRVEEAKEPVIEAGSVKIRVEWCGICGSDMHEYLAGPITIPVDQPHPISGAIAPVIMGHEFSGQVVEVGEGVQRIKVGDRVCVEPIINCGTCDSCRKGLYNLCEKLGLHGMSGNGGGFSEMTVVKEHMVHKIPDHVSYEQGALVEPVAVALHAVRQSKLKSGDNCVVFGLGPIGLAVIQCLKASGATKVVAVDIAPERREKALSLGATHAVDPLKENVTEVVRELTGKGADVCFEVAGVEPTLASAVDCVKQNGQVMIVSLWEKNPSIAMNSLVFKEIDIKGTICYRDIFPAVIEMMADGRLQSEKLITNKIKLDDITENGFEAILKNKNEIKILVTAQAGE
ncbi:2,3-butanediol dehydrogenase [Paenibacillus sp.]|jgi:(R,R)-butanediol dehydrogenase/meso-butanediol dehydrogenase/diacetyl reductase|uniref:2,3-butanediol dehydrogenase n=1 Tax=Paenibacillus sp. TaxID=58172 RepID=UPI00281EF4DD|nr:2,3-butanediol dehydrogenase [Paenibacillus sp.]MDR0267984.1 2,3-butanediol dehydrogenase [Paenibacillus sp.]